MPVLLIPPRPSRSRRWSSRLCLLLGGGFLVWAAWFIWRSSVVGFDGVRRFCLFDDAMIAMRYGWNVAHGAGAVWNVGEQPRVEGYTNPLVVALMAVVARLCSPHRSAAVLVIQLAGIPLALLNAWTLKRIAREALLLPSVGGDGVRREPDGSGRHPDAQTLETLAFAAALTFYPLLYWTLLGMETGPLALLLSASVLLALKYARNPRPAFGFGLAGTLALAYLARPDAVLFAGLVFGYLILCTRRLPARSRCRSGERRWWEHIPNWAAPVSAYGSVLVAHLLWRHAYYGSWVPNTYVLKMVGFPLRFRLVNGLHYLAPFLGACRWLGLIVAAGLLLDFRREKLFLAAFPLTMIAYQIYVGGDPWDLWRQVAPTVPLALLLAAHELLRLTRALVPHAGTTGVHPEGVGARGYFSGESALVPASALAPLLATGVLGALILAPLNAPYTREILALSPPLYTDANAYDVNVGVALREVTTPQARVGAAALGAIAYYSERPSVDLLGKCDLRVARLAPDLSGAVSWNRMKSVPGHNKYDFAYSVEELQPDYVQLFRWGRQDVSAWAREHYDQASFHGVTLPLRRNSPAVRWELLDSVETLAGTGKTEKPPGSPGSSP